MRDHSHLSTSDSSHCAHCGKPLTLALGYGAPRKSNKLGIAVTIVAHVLVLLLLLLRDEVSKRAPPPAGATMVYLAPLKGKTKPTPTPSKPRQVAKTAPPKVQIERLPNTITLPEEKVVETKIVPEKVAPPEPEDMEARIAERRRQRAEAARSDNTAPQESEGERANRIAKANIAAANGRSAGSDRNDTGGVFTILNQNFHSAEVKFRGWNSNFKRNWSQQVIVEQGSEPDLETAIVKRMIELIRKEKTGDFVWDSQRLGHTVPMSARIEDTAELQAFLMKEMFPQYRPPRR